MDLSLFQFDYDLSMATVFMNADKTIYARYGSRSGQGEDGQLISMEGLRETLQGVLKLHQDYPANTKLLAGKQPRPVKQQRPEEFAELKRFKSENPDPGTVMKNCMHCHQIRDAERTDFRRQRQPIPDEVLHPWPLPAVLGLELDVQTRSTVGRVSPDSPAKQAGFQEGDELVSLAGQPIVSLADVQWVLHSMSADDIFVTLSAKVRRDSTVQVLSLMLPRGWRSRSDISWRTTTWDLRRMATGGLVLEALPDERREKLKLEDNQPALYVKYVGQYGEHAVGKNAGFQKDDVLLEFDGQSVRATETDLLAYVAKNCMPGKKVPVTILRGEKRMMLTLPIQ